MAKTEIYDISFLREGYEGRQERRHYKVGAGMMSDLDGKPMTILSIKLAFGILTTEFSDGTSHSMGYDHNTMEIFRRQIKPKEEDGKSETGNIEE